MSTSIAKTSIKIGGDVSELEAAAGQAVGKLKGMVSSAIAVLGTAVSIKWGIDLLAASESAQMAMESVVGSADLAKSTIKGLRQQFGDETKHFSKSFRELALAGYALEDIPGILRIIGDASTAIGPDDWVESMGEITRQLVLLKETGHVTEKQLKSLGAMGINAFDMLKNAGKFASVSELRDKLGKDQIDSGFAIQGLLSGMDAKFKGAFEKHQSTNLKEILGDFGDQAAQGMKAFMEGAVGGGDIKKWLRSLVDDMGALVDVGRSAGEIVGAAFKTVGNVFEGVWAIAKQLGEVILAMFSDGKTSLTDYLKETSNLRLDIDALKNGALTFAEVVSEAFAYLGDKISQYLVDPITAFAGMFLGFISTIIKGVEKVIGLLPDMVLPDGLVEGLAAASADLDKMGKGLVDHANRDFQAGDVMLNRTRDMFAGLRGGGAGGGDFDGGKIASTAPDLSGVLGVVGQVVGPAMDFTKAVKSMASTATNWTEEFQKLTNDLNEAYQKELDSKANKLIDEARSPAEVFRRELKDLEEMFKQGAISKSELALGAANALKGLASTLPSYSPNSVIRAGSEEAQRTVLENRRGGGRGVDELLKQSLAVQQDSRKTQEDILDEIKKSGLLPRDL